MSRRHVLVDDMLDDFDGAEHLNMLDPEAGLPMDDTGEMFLDFPSVWEMYEAHALFDVSELDRKAEVAADERKLNPSANRERLRKQYWKDPEVARAKVRERVRQWRAVRRAARS